MKRYVVDEENISHLKNIRIIFCARSTQDITIEQVFLYDADVTDEWYEVTSQFIMNLKKLNKLENIASDYLEDLLSRPVTENQGDRYDGKRY